MKAEDIRKEFGGKYVDDLWNFTTNSPTPHWAVVPVLVEIAAHLAEMNEKLASVISGSGELRKSLESAALGRHSRLLGVNGHSGTFSTCPHSDCKQARETLGEI